MPVCLPHGTAAARRASCSNGLERPSRSTAARPGRCPTPAVAATIRASLDSAGTEGARRQHPEAVRARAPDAAGRRVGARARSASTTSGAISIWRPLRIGRDRAGAREPHGGLAGRWIEQFDDALVAAGVQGLGHAPARTERGKASGGRRERTGGPTTTRARFARRCCVSLVTLRTRARLQRRARLVDRGAGEAEVGRLDAARRRRRRSPPRTATPRCTRSTCPECERPWTRRIATGSSTALASFTDPALVRRTMEWRWGRRCGRRTRKL